MNNLKRTLPGIAICSVLLSVTLMIGSLWAGPPVSTQLPQRKAVPAKAKSIPITTETGDLEIVTTLEGRHYWQVPVRNTSHQDAENFPVIVVVEGFRQEDRVQTSGVIELLKAGEASYARAELPDFEGMHRIRVTVGGSTRTVEIPRPFRKDADGYPVKALKIEKLWAQKVGGNPRWYLKTKPNLYGTIKPNEVQFLITFRERKHKHCHLEDFKSQLINYLDPESPFGGTVTNKAEIKPGESITLSGELNETTAKRQLPKYMDRLIVRNAFTGGVLMEVKLDTGSFYPASYDNCSD